MPRGSSSLVLLAAALANGLWACNPPRRGGGADAGGDDAGIAPVPDAGPGGEDGGTADTVPPRVLGAVSSDGKSATVHFSEPVAPSAAVAANYAVKAKTVNEVLIVDAAQVRGEYVTLTINPSTPFNPANKYEVVVDARVTDLAGNGVQVAYNRAEIKRPIYLNVVWHQHQPLYLDPVKDQLSSPWVRKHGTKDYYDMAAILRRTPSIHLNVNLTSVLLQQLRIYVDRLLPFVDLAANRVREAEFFARWRGKTDPFVDLLLDDTPDPTCSGRPGCADDTAIGLFWKDPWSTVSTSEALLARFPEYRALRYKPPLTYTRSDWLELKAWFEIAWFDPDFLRGPVQMPDGSVVNLSDLVEPRVENGIEVFRLKSGVAITEDLCNRLVAENAKVVANVVPVHRGLAYDPARRTGQIEIITTPFFHPILPLLIDSDLAKAGQPTDALPARFAAPDDAYAQVARAVKFYRDTFGLVPRGMWPGEGAVAEAAVDVFVRNGIRWVATGQQVMERSGRREYTTPYRVDVNATADAAGTDQDLAIVFRSNDLSDRIGFRYQGLAPTDAVNDFVGEVLRHAPPFGQPDRLLTVVLDGENAWESYVKDHDAKGFLAALYARLAAAQDAGEILTVTTSEYLEGNPNRAIPAHPVKDLPEIEPLFPGSWIDGTFSTWIGEGEENAGWECLRRVRADLASSGLPRPNPLGDPPDPTADPAGFANFVAYDEMYAAEGSDWFWWFGADMTTPANDDTPFDEGFRAHLGGVYTFMNRALSARGRPTVPPFACPVVVQAAGKVPAGPFTYQPNASPPVDKRPVLDGRIDPVSEWTQEGGYVNDADSGAANDPRDQIGRLYYGTEGAEAGATPALYLAVEAKIDLSTRLGRPYTIAAYLPQKHVVDPDAGTFARTPNVAGNAKTRNGTPLAFKDANGALYELAVDFATGSAVAALSRADGAGGWTLVPTTTVKVGGPLAGGQVLEVRIPYADLALSTSTNSKGQVLLDPIEAIAVASEAGVDVDLAPSSGSLVVIEDVTNQVFVTFEVDVSGRTPNPPLDFYGTCCRNPPPPAGQGVVYIAGNHPKLGLKGDKWVPNLVNLTPDPATPTLWRITVPMPLRLWAQYKYTIGITSDQGTWSGTEEYPVTQRGFVLEDKSDGKGGLPNKRIVVRDVFADKPVGGRDNQPGSLTTFPDD